MKRLALALGLICAVHASAADVSFRNEMQHAIDRGLEWLQKNQNKEGYWSTAEHPAVTALALVAFKGDPRKRFKDPEPAWMQRGYDYLLGCARPDGGIHRTNLVTYNTSIAMVGLLAAEKPAYDPVIRKARAYLVGLQGKSDDVFDGGIGYGSKYQHSDMGNTLQALEALYHSRHLALKDVASPEPDLNWQAAIKFLQNCQNLPGVNTQSWVSSDPKDKGGFVYYPGHSMAGGVTNQQTGRVALRSYGSISYGGLLSYIYAQMKHDDPRVVAVFNWLKQNYTLEENPAMGAQGLYYYYHTMAKALSLYGVDQLELADGRKIDWRKDLAMRLINLQQKDGSWLNDNGRWWERDPALVTAYGVLTLEIISRPAYQ
ncbi:MAG TPA: prenyltransferase/squalene oxidase repeat-containing protein [Verrucomicrobiae bacterium]|nr:prenyltransferase/squalene oxidase repeat-containing protein [Verrucomicrobiae bacterium]